MSQQTSLFYLLCGGTVCQVLLLLWSWRRNTVTTGLPLCYLFAIGIIHFTGALVDILPANQKSDIELVYIGFKECVAGVVAFVCGVFFYDWIQGAFFPNQLAAAGASAGGMRDSAVDVPADMPATARPGRPRQKKREVMPAPVDPATARLPGTYIMLGLIFIMALIPLLRAIPSFGAVASSGAFFVVAGCCLACWRHWLQNDRWRVIAWSCATLGFPLFTMFMMGFIGYGVSAALVVLTFVCCFYRPRWQSILIFVVLFFLGLSVFVTYMRDRSELREMVWKGTATGHGYLDRVLKIWTIFSNFEVIDFQNMQHLQMLDDRLNQNYLVGGAVVKLHTGDVDFAKGETIRDAALALVPRILWPSKPMRAGSPEVVSRYTGLTFASNTSVGVGQVLEFYINFGRWGILVGFFAFGLILRLLDWRAATRLVSGDWRGFVMWFLPGLPFLNCGGSLVEVTSGAAAAFVLVYVVHYFLRGTSSAPLQQLKMDRRRGARAAGPGGTME